VTLIVTYTDIEINLIFKINFNYILTIFESLNDIFIKLKALVVKSIATFKFQVQQIKSNFRIN